MPKKKKVIRVLLGIAGILCLVYPVLYYNGYQSYRACELLQSINPAGWEQAISYSMLSPELQEIISEEEFTDSAPEVRFQMYKKLEGLILDDRPLKHFDGSTNFWKSPYGETYEIDGTSYFVEFRIDIKCRLNRMEVRNFVCYIQEQACSERRTP